MTLATQIVDQWVSGIVDEHRSILEQELGAGADDSTKRSLAFLVLAARSVLELPDDEVFDGIVDGGGDFGVDCLYFEPPRDGEIRVALIQGKYKRDLRGVSAFPENGIARMVDAIGALFDPARKLALNPRLMRRLEEVRSFVRDGAIPRVTAIATNNGARWTEVAERRIRDAADLFGEQVEWRHVGPEELLTLRQANERVDADLRLTGLATVEDFNFRRALVGRMSVGELIRLTNRYGHRVFQRNIRGYLGLPGNRVNEAVAKTLRDVRERPNFYFYNNGVTMTCSQFRHNALQREDWRVRVKDLQIVNGGQTARTAQRVAAELLGPGIESAEVLVRIYEIEADDADFVEAITFATNSQNPVELRDLRANDERQRKLASSFANLGYAYRRKREVGSVGSREFTSALVAEAVLAVWRGRPHQARFGRRRHFGALYDTIFTEGLNGAQAVLGCLILRTAENRRKRPPSEAPGFLPYASRFVAMLVGRYLLDDLSMNLDGLDHRAFAEARERFEEQKDGYVRRAEDRIRKELATLFNGREQTLQRLSATFRRADRVEMLLEPAA